MNTSLLVCRTLMPESHHYAEYWTYIGDTAKNYVRYMDDLKYFLKLTTISFYDILDHFDIPYNFYTISIATSTC